MSRPKPNVKINPHDTRPVSLIQGDLFKTIQRGVTKVFIAEVAGLHVSIVSKIARGKQQTLSTYSLGRLMTALDKIDNGEVTVPERHMRPPTPQARMIIKGDTCTRLHPREKYTVKRENGTRYCVKCQEMARYKREKERDGYVNDLQNELAARVRMQMGQQGWTVKHLAGLVGLNPKYLTRTLNGFESASVLVWDKLLKASAVPDDVNDNTLEG